MTLIVTDGRVMLADKRATEKTLHKDLICQDCDSNKPRIKNSDVKISLPLEPYKNFLPAKFNRSKVIAFANAGTASTGSITTLALQRVDLYDLLVFFNFLHEENFMPKKHKDFFPFANNSVLFLTKGKDGVKIIHVSIRDREARFAEHSVGTVIAIGSGADKFRTWYDSGNLSMLDAFQFAAYNDKSCNFGSFDALVVGPDQNAVLHKGVRYKRTIEELIEVCKRSLDKPAMERETA